MTKTSLLLLALAAGAPLLAQAPGLTMTAGDSSVTLYGILDAGVATVSHTLDFNEVFPASVNPTITRFGDSSATGVINGGISPTRWGIKGSTSLGAGWKAIFTLESAFNLPSGQVSNAAQGLAQNYAGKATSSTGQTIGSAQSVSADSSVSGQLFNRGAYVGVASEKYGQLTIGRQQSLMLDTIPSYDALGYEKGNFGVVFVYQSFQDATTVGNPSGGALSAAQIAAGLTVQPIAGTIAATFYDTKNTNLVARYKVGPVWIKGGWQSLKYTNPSDPITDLNTTALYGQVISSWSVTPYTVNGMQATKTLTVTWLGAAWDVTSKFNVAASYYKVHQGDYSNGIVSPAGTKYSAGDTTYTSLLLDYTFTKAFDAYAGFMSVSANGGMILANASGAAVPYLNDSNSIMGLGIRYRF